MKCAVCGAENDATAAFCYRCGSALQPVNAPSTGATTMLKPGDTPPFGLEAITPDANNASARVYDAPAAPSNQYGQGSTGGAQRPAPPSYEQPQPDAQTYGSQSYNLPNQYGPSSPNQYGAGNNQPYGQYSVGAVQQNNTALIALILGILSLFGLSYFGAIPAIILGRNARREIAASNGMQSGAGMAQAGIVIGWISVALSTLGCLCVGILLISGGFSSY